MTFGVLVLFWWAGDWKTKPGLFHYRSATVGYGLLVPIAIALLAAGVRHLRQGGGEADDRRFVTGGVAGAVAALGVQAAWLADPHPAGNWSFPEAHHFNSAGIYHAAALTAVSAIITALGVVVVARQRRLSRAQSKRTIADSHPPEIPQQALAVFVGCASALAGLVALDDDRANGTQAGIASLIALGLAVVVVVCALWLAFGHRLRRHWVALVQGVAGGAGAVALSQYGIEASLPIAAVGLLTAVLGGAGSSVPLMPGHPALRWTAAGSACLAIAGTVAQTVALAPDHGAAAGAVVVIGVGVGSAAGAAGVPFTAATVLRALALLFCVATLGWTAWLDARPDADAAAAAFNAVAVLFEVLVLVLVRDRFRELVTEEKKVSGEDPPDGTGGDARTAAPGYAAWTQFVSHAVPAVLAALVFLTVASPLLGSNGVSTGAAASPTPLLVPGGALAVFMTALGAGIAWRRRPGEREKVDAPLPVPIPSTLLAAGGTVVFVVFCAMESKGPLRLEGLAAIVAALYAALCVEDLRASAARIQLARVGFGGWPIALGAALAQGAAVYWLVAFGLWHHGRPASVGSMLVTGASVLGIAFAIHACAGLSLAMSVPGKPVTPEPPWLNVPTIALMYGALAILAVLPAVFVIGRVEAAGDLANAGTVVLGSVFIVPSCLAAYGWILLENFRHLRRQKAAGAPPAVRELADSELLIDTYEGRRIARLREHVWSQLILTLAFVLVPLGSAAYVSV
jgi:hypothetical protein